MVLTLRYIAIFAMFYDLSSSSRVKGDHWTSA